MTRPDKHAARFGDRYRPSLDYRRLAKAVRESLPIIRSITAAVRRVGEGLRDHTLAVVPSRSQPGRLALVESRWAEGGGGTLSFVSHVANMAAPTVAELEAGRPASAGTHSGGDVVDIDASSYSLGQWVALVGAHAASPEFRAADHLARSQPAWPSADILDRIDDTLLTYDSQHATGERPWPYGSSF